MPQIKPYRRSKAVAYAKKWAFDRNPAFYDFSDLGGDCTNFASQCLYAGSEVMNFEPENGWYYISLNDRSPSWTGVEFLYQFLVNNTTKAVFAKEVAMEEIEPGDVIQLLNFDGRYYHTLVVVETGKIPDEDNILVSAHSFNAYKRPLSSYTKEGARFLHIEGVYV